MPPCTPPSGKIFVPEASTLLCLMAFLISTSSSFTFRDIRGVPNLHQGALRSPEVPSVKILKLAQVLAYIYIIVNFQLRSSIHAGLTERTLYNRFALKNPPKWGFWGILGEGLRYLVGTP